MGAKHPEHSIVAIENGHVTGRKVGDGASHVVLEQVRQADAQPSDHLSYLTKTPDGKILKSSTMYIRGRNGKVVAILGINYDISSLLMVEDAVHELIDTGFPVSSTAKVMYCRMLDAMLFRGQADENGILFVCFPITAIAAVLSRSLMTVKRSLNELETAGLIMRVRQGVGEPNRIYVLIPGKEGATLA